MMRKATVYAGLLAMAVGMASVQAPEGRAQGGIDRQMVYVPGANISQIPLMQQEGAELFDTVTNVDAPKNFFIGKTEVTGALWQEVYDWAVTKGYTFVNQGSNLGTLLPVTNVSWYDVVVWTNAYSEKEKLEPVYRNRTTGNVLKDARAKEDLFKAVQRHNAYGYRLPTGIEWVMAARWLGTTAPTIGSLKNERIATIGNDGKTYYWTPWDYASGATENWQNAAETGAVAWYNSNSGGTAKQVGGKRANALGMFDVGGNVWEWLFTPTHARGGDRGKWGGSWGNGGSIAIVSAFASASPLGKSASTGFRLARGPFTFCRITFLPCVWNSKESVK